MPASTDMTADEGYGARKSGATVKTESWVNVTAAFTKEIGADDVKTEYLRRCIGLIVAPTGDIVMQTAEKGICISKDQGGSWSVVADNKILGRCEHGFGFSIANPYDGRMALFSYDGKGGISGGISLDGAKTWSPFTNQVRRGTEYGDIDWNTPGTQVIYAVTHEPLFSVLSEDGGKNWQRIDNEETGKLPRLCVGVIGGKKLVRYNPGKEGGVVELSEDAGQTWIKVTADFHVSGQRPVHYGQNVYWTSSEGVITSTNGKDWSLTGKGAEGANYGPYFGSNEQEFVVVTDKSFLKTEDGGKTWRPVAKFYKAPDIFKKLASYCYFGWDSAHNILYASGLGASIYKLQLE